MADPLIENHFGRDARIGAGDDNGVGLLSLLVSVALRLTYTLCQRQQVAPEVAASEEGVAFLQVFPYLLGSVQVLFCGNLMESVRVSVRVSESEVVLYRCG